MKLPVRHKRGPIPSPRSKSNRPFDKVELELIRADIAMLKQQEKESGAWDEWKKNQAMHGPSNKYSNRELMEKRGARQADLEMYFGPDPRVPIEERTKQIVKAKKPRKPQSKESK